MYFSCAYYNRNMNVCFKAKYFQDAVLIQDLRNVMTHSYVYMSLLFILEDSIFLKVVSVIRQSMCNFEKERKRDYTWVR